MLEERLLTVICFLCVGMDSYCSYVSCLTDSSCFLFWRQTIIVSFMCDESYHVLYETDYVLIMSWRDGYGILCLRQLVIVTDVWDAQSLCVLCWTEIIVSTKCDGRLLVMWWMDNFCVGCVWGIVMCPMHWNGR